MTNTQTTSPHNGFVTVLTPVYNGAAYLRECIESVLAQSLQDWRYIIVDNRSTDATVEIACEYARADARIQVVTNDNFLSMPGNFNRAFSLVPAESKYVKVVCADDWILPECLRELVGYAEAHPTVGIVGCHQQSGDHVRWRELPADIDFIPGREACRLALMQGTQIFGAPSAFLYRADMLREEPFYPNDRPYSDTSACYEKLDHWDFGVVHKILTFERVHSGQITAMISDVAPGDVAYVDTFVTYGRRYLSEPEYAKRFHEIYTEYCKGLGRGVLNLKSRKFWEYQRAELAKLGLRIDYGLVLRGALTSFGKNVARPASAGRKVSSVLSGRLGR